MWFHDLEQPSSVSPGGVESPSFDLEGASLERDANGRYIPCIALDEAPDEELDEAPDERADFPSPLRSAERGEGDVAPAQGPVAPRGRRPARVPNRGGGFKRPLEASLCVADGPHDFRPYGTRGLWQCTRCMMPAPRGTMRTLTEEATCALCQDVVEEAPVFVCTDRAQRHLDMARYMRECDKFAPVTLCGTEGHAMHAGCVRAWIEVAIKEKELRDFVCPLCRG